jgi:uncharacterized protein (DUF952 family)
VRVVRCSGHVDYSIAMWMHYTARVLGKSQKARLMPVVRRFHVISGSGWEKGRSTGWEVHPHLYACLGLYFHAMSELDTSFEFVIQRESV